MGSLLVTHVPLVMRFAYSGYSVDPRDRKKRRSCQDRKSPTVMHLAKTGTFVALLAAFLGLHLTVEAGAQSGPEGIYYVRGGEGNGKIYPERLMIYNSDGSYELDLVYHGIRGVLLSTYSVRRDKISIAMGRLKNDCLPPGLESMGRPPPIEFKFLRKPHEIIFSGSQGTYSVGEATKAEIEHVQSVPECK